MKPRIIRIFYTLGLGVALASTSAFAQTSPAQPDSAPPATTTDPAQAKYSDGAVVIVNDQIVTVSQLKKVMDPQMKVISQEVQEQATDEASYKAEFQRREQAVEQEDVNTLVNRILIVAEFHKKYQPMPQAYLDKVFEDYITVHFNGDHEAYLNALKANNITERDLRKQLEENEIIGYMYSKLRSSVTGISPDRIKNYYDINQDKFKQEAAIDLRQITLKPPSPGTPPDVLLQKALFLVQQARAPGGDFAELARQNSQDEYAAQGGLCGWLELPRLAPIIQVPLSNLAPGDVSDPIVMDPAKIPAGQTPMPDSEKGTIYIFKCEDKHAGGIQPLEDVRAQIENTLAVQDSVAAEQKWLDGLRKNAYIHFNYTE
jgi:parvulin-like peptidyl-prolyl isomerase